MVVSEVAQAIEVLYFEAAKVHMTQAHFDHFLHGKLYGVSRLMNEGLTPESWVQAIATDVDIQTLRPMGTTLDAPIEHSSRRVHIVCRLMN